MSAAKLIMKLTGRASGWIKGESKVDEHRDQIELHEWGWGLEPAGDRHQSQKLATPLPLTFSKLADRATAKMLTAMRRGEFLDAELTIWDNSDEYIEVTARLKKALLVKYQLRLEPGERSGEIVEDWTFDYAQIVFEHRASVREGFASVTLDRPADASDDNPGAAARQLKDEIGELYDRIGEDKLKAQFETWLAELKKEKVSIANAEKDRIEKDRADKAEAAKGKGAAAAKPGPAAKKR